MTHESTAQFDVIVIGGGVAGLSAALFTARHGLETLSIDAGGSILRRNAHLENVPGFPVGVDGRRFLDLLKEQADRAGASYQEGTVTGLERLADTFAVETDTMQYQTEYAIAATKNEVDYLEDVDGVGIVDRGKTFVDTDERGRTGIAGLYAAGRLAGKPHQAAVCAGHGAEVGVTILEDHDRPFYHDWVAPDGYFTDRGRDLPPGCEEIDAAERERRAEASRAVMQEHFAEPHPGEQLTHPSLSE
ncbi:FAD-binding protein [Halorhabdus sp. CBA1104]|uniref:NAD(P)/FAD-dependent oxidoreductase n=1 Tax=Halorhabdus sp. CBA1104 TaxID=1380432 RepID=UPI0012B41D3B|nr:NAD(P)/FAD-dependent oxidoreductase [Halorhabdus sp. CBA1104]QGN07887.1 FAD-binding protein [Halorhabdus sp. CBA1104]